MYFLRKTTSLEESGLITGLPRSLLIKLVHCIYAKEIRHIQLFRSSDQAFVTDLIMRSKPLQVRYSPPRL